MTLATSAIDNAISEENISINKFLMHTSCIIYIYIPIGLLSNNCCLIDIYGGSQPGTPKYKVINASSRLIIKAAFCGAIA